MCELAWTVDWLPRTSARGRLALLVTNAAQLIVSKVDAVVLLLATPTTPSSSAMACPAKLGLNAPPTTALAPPAALSLTAPRALQRSPTNA